MMSRGHVYIVHALRLKSKYGYNDLQASYNGL